MRIDRLDAGFVVACDRFESFQVGCCSFGGLVVNFLHIVAVVTLIFHIFQWCSGGSHW